MCKIISVISCKGGVGKTTSAVNISSYIQTQGKRVCTVDLDYQHNLSKHFGVLPGHLKNRPTMYDLFLSVIDDYTDSEMNELVHNSIVKSTTVDVIPSTAKLSSLDKVLPTVTCRELLLKNILKHMSDIKLVKTIRGYGGIFVSCTQNTIDYFALNSGKFGDAVLNNSRLKLLLQMEEPEALKLKEKVGLSDEEVVQILRCGRGQGLLCAGKNRIAVEIRSSQTQYDLITTNRADLEKREIK